jgi:RNA polymerase sigma-70 factor
VDPIDQLAAAFQTRWPAARFERARLATQIAGLDGDHRDDVVLAWAVAAGIAPAIADVDALVASAVQHVRARNLAGNALDDIAQLARVRLLTGDGITSYQGRGSLAAFVRTIVMRLAIDHVRATREQPADDVASLLDHVATNPELAHMRDRYAADLADALRTAWSALAAHERFVLELELHQHLSIEQIARVYGVHRTNATRRIASARAALVSGVRAALREKLQIADATLDSILRLLTTSRRWSALATIAEP